MTILIDADGCPVVDLTLRSAGKKGVPVVILCDTSHRIEREGAQTLVFDKGADSVDFALVNRVKPGDLVVTQDYGLASMCLAKCARVLNQNGLESSDPPCPAHTPVPAPSAWSFLQIWLSCAGKYLHQSVTPPPSLGQFVSKCHHRSPRSFFCI